MNGHDTDVVGRADSNRQCIRCKREQNLVSRMSPRRLETLRESNRRRVGVGNGDFRTRMPTLELADAARALRNQMREEFNTSLRRNHGTSQ